jgi:UDP-N-acetylmuramate dehydrogenase
MSEALARAEAILRETCGDRVRASFPMAPLTTFRIGGPAALYLEPESDEDLAAVARAWSGSALPLVVIGKGSNLLVADRGFPGIVLRLGRGYRWTARDGERLSAGAATPLPALAGVANQHGLTGLEFGIAIPATLGGAVRMNAGAHSRSMADVVERVDVYDLDADRPRSVPAAELGFSYRRSGLTEAAVVTGAMLRLAVGAPALIRDRMDEARDWRRRTQPLAEPNCGSVFKNPPGDHAARLIDEVGLKGLRVGGASVSRKHANFIVADPGAHAQDVAALIGEIRSRVRSATGVELEPEVHLIGAFDDAA